jgi:hypothetical protein
MDLQELIDRQTITDVLTRYCRGVDRMDIETVRSVFHPDAVTHHPPYADGPVEEFLTSLEVSADQTMRWTHSLTNALVELAGDTAHSEAYFVSLSRSHNGDGLIDYLFCGRYLDRLERRDGQWRIAERTVVRDLIRVDPVADVSEVEAARGIVGERSRADPLYALLERADE